MSLPTHADVIVVNRRPGPALRPGDLVPERRPLRKPGPGEVIVRNLVTTVDPYQLRMLRGSPEITAVAVGEPVPANSVGVVVASEDPAVPPGTQVATYTGWQSYATTTIAPSEIADSGLGGPLEWLSVLGTTGVAAYVGIHDVGGCGRAAACWSARPAAPWAAPRSSWPRPPGHASWPSPAGGSGPIMPSRC